jgi:hypothetical protein
LIHHPTATRTRHQVVSRPPHPTRRMLVASYRLQHPHRHRLNPHLFHPHLHRLQPRWSQLRPLHHLLLHLRQQRLRQLPQALHQPDALHQQRLKFDDRQYSTDHHADNYTK